MVEGWYLENERRGKDLRKENDFYVVWMIMLYIDYTISLKRSGIEKVEETHLYTKWLIVN
jgi:hypothetical protein